VNGSIGIGTGFSTSIPPHNPLIIIRNLIHLMDGEELEKMEPWFRGFIGEVSYKGLNDYGYEQYQNKGIYEVVDDSTLRIRELPVGRWTSKYKIYLETLMNEKNEDGKQNRYVLQNIQDNSTDKVVNFTLKFKRNGVDEMRDRGDIEDVLKLTESKNCNYSNMHLYNSRGVIAKYDSVEDILKEFYIIRLAYYMRRKEYLLRIMRKELDKYEAKIRFIREFISGEIQIIQKEDEEIQTQLEERNYPKFGDDEDESKMNYNYLLHMRIQSLTRKKIEELERLHANKLAEFQNLESKTEKDLWKDDLFELRNVIERHYQEYDEMMEVDRNGENPQSKTKKVAKKTTKKILK
jgi:DNA topoisomerase-2